MEKNNDEPIKNAISQAEKVVKASGVEDEELKKIAFSKAVDYFLHDNQNLTQGVQLSPKSTSTPTVSINQGFWENLAETTGHKIEALKDVYAVKNEKQVLLVIPTVRGKTLVEQRKNLAALILLAYHEGLKQEWIPANLLAESAKHSNLYSDSKFALNLKMNWFRTEGQKKGLKYKLSGVGVSEAKKLLTELLQTI